MEYFSNKVFCHQGFLGGSMVKNLPANAGNTGLIPGSVGSPGEEIGNPLQYSFLGKTMERGAWRPPMRSHRVRHDLATAIFFFT